MQASHKRLRSPYGRIAMRCLPHTIANEPVAASLNR